VKQFFQFPRADPRQINNGAGSENDFLSPAATTPRWPIFFPNEPMTAAKLAKADCEWKKIKKLSRLIYRLIALISKKSQIKI